MADSANVPRAGAGADRIVFLGHSTVLIELDGVRLLTDPFLRSRVAHLRRRPAPPDPRHYTSPDAVLISHLHQDHLDLPSLHLIGSSTPLVVPAGAGAWLRGRGFTDITELSVGGVANVGVASVEGVASVGGVASVDGQRGVGRLKVTAVPAHHDGRRRPRGPRAEALGLIVHGSHAIYFAGDTELFAGMAELSPSPDVALLPVAGWGETLGPGHMDPLHAARAARLIHPRLAIPIHWGTLRPIVRAPRHQPRLAVPPRLFAEHVASLAPGVEVRILAPGQETVL